MRNNAKKLTTEVNKHHCIVGVEITCLTFLLTINRNCDVA